MTERKAGWYWVREFANTPWKCQQWNGEWWQGRGMYHDMAVVGHRIPTPDEPWRLVPSEVSDPDDELMWSIIGLMEDMQGSHKKLYRNVLQRKAEEWWQDMLAAAPSPGDDQ